MIYTDFDILIAIFAFLTFTAIFAPVEQYFRQNLTNSLFVGVLLFIVTNTPFDIDYIYSLDSLILMKDKLMVIGGVSLVVALFLRFRDSSLYDTLFLGFGVYTTLFVGFMSFDFLSPFLNSSLFYVLFIFGFVVFTWNKLLISMIFSIKRIGDSYK